MDGLYARVWSGDALTENKSTFMTEMSEMASILHTATKQSFIVVDELGRWTSTYDGVAIASALCVYVCQYLWAFTQFATHYHELTELSVQIEQFDNFHVGVHDTWSDVIFLKSINPGPLQKSYWIRIADQAWLPRSVIAMADEYLAQLTDVQRVTKPTQAPIQHALLAVSETPPYEEILTQVDIENTTPLEALRILNDLARLQDQSE